MSVIDVDPVAYESARDTCYLANHDGVDVVLALSNGLDGGAGMAGSDSSGVEWATSYDTAAAQALEAGTTAVNTLGHIGDLLDTTAANHANADASSTIGGHPTQGGSSSSSSLGAESLFCPDPPSANGSPGDEPPGWGLIAGSMSLVWPNGHQDQLRAVGSAWSTAAGGLTSCSYRLSSVISEVDAQRSPEVASAVATLTDLQTQIDDLSTAYDGLGQACNDYAAHLDEAHHEIIEELESLVAWTIAFEAGGALLGFFTAGISVAGAQAAVAARIAATVARVTSVLTRLAGLVRAIIATVGRFAPRLTEILAKLKTILGKRATTAIEEAAGAIAGGMTKAEAAAAYQGMNKGGGHAIRHLIDEGLIANTGSLASKVTKFEELTAGILTSPAKTFPWKIGSTDATAYAGIVNGERVVLFVADSGPYAGKVVSSVVPDAGQILQWGL